MALNISLVKNGMPLNILSDFFSKLRILDSYSLVSDKNHPDNGQEITYTYERGDFINQMFISLYDDLGSFTFGGGILTPECSSSSHTAIEDSYQGSLISPVYLNRISFPECEITFAREVTTELEIFTGYLCFSIYVMAQKSKISFSEFSCR